MIPYIINAGLILAGCLAFYKILLAKGNFLQAKPLYCLCYAWWSLSDCRCCRYRTSFHSGKSEPVVQVTRDQSPVRETLTSNTQVACRHQATNTAGNAVCIICICADHFFSTGNDLAGVPVLVWRDRICIQFFVADGGAPLSCIYETGNYGRAIPHRGDRRR